MIISTGLRGKVERLLKGDVRQTDLHDIFFQMRDETGGNGLVGEIANFPAHPVRGQGPIWQDVNNAAACLRLRVSMNSSPLKSFTLSSSVPDILRGNFRRARTRRTDMIRALHMTAQQAESILERVLTRALPVSPGRIQKFEIRDRDELRVLKFISLFFRGGSLFDEHALFEDLCRALQKHNVLSLDEKRVLKKRARAAVSIYALVAMSGKEIDLGDGTTATLSIVGDTRGNLGCFAGAEIHKFPNGDMVRLFNWIFETSLKISEYCDPDIVPLERVPFLGDFHLEVDANSGRAKLGLI